MGNVEKRFGGKNTETVNIRALPEGYQRHVESSPVFTTGQTQGLLRAVSQWRTLDEVRMDNRFWQSLDSERPGQEKEKFERAFAVSSSLQEFIAL